LPKLPSNCLSSNCCQRRLSIATANVIAVAWILWTDRIHSFKSPSLIATAVSAGFGLAIVLYLERRKNAGAASRSQVWGRAYDVLGRQKSNPSTLAGRPRLTSVFMEPVATPFFLIHKSRARPTPARRRFFSNSFYCMRRASYKNFAVMNCVFVFIFSRPAEVRWRSRVSGGAAPAPGNSAAILFGHGPRFGCSLRCRQARRVPSIESAARGCPALRGRGGRRLQR